MLFDEDLGALARKVWNRFGFTLSISAIKFNMEHSHKNLFHFLRESNFSVFSNTIKAAAFAIELYQGTHLAEIIQDLIAFYRDEW